MKIEVDGQKFGTICVCALWYAMGRGTYMPSLVRDFVHPLLPKLSDKTLSVMKADCEFQARYDCYGDEKIDKPDWIKWAEEIEAEIKKGGKPHDNRCMDFVWILNCDNSVIRRSVMLLC